MKNLLVIALILLSQPVFANGSHKPKPQPEVRTEVRTEVVERHHDNSKYVLVGLISGIAFCAWNPFEWTFCRTEPKKPIIEIKGKPNT